MRGSGTTGVGEALTELDAVKIKITARRLPGPAPDRVSDGVKIPEALH